jgi:hypothetical protein
MYKLAVKIVTIVLILILLCLSKNNTGIKIQVKASPSAPCVVGFLLPDRDINIPTSFPARGAPNDSIPYYFIFREKLDYNNLTFKVKIFNKYFSFDAKSPLWQEADFHQGISSPPSPYTDCPTCHYVTGNISLNDIKEAMQSAFGGGADYINLILQNNPYEIYLYSKDISGKEELYCGNTPIRFNFLPPDLSIAPVTCRVVSVTPAQPKPNELITLYAETDKITSPNSITEGPITYTPVYYLESVITEEGNSPSPPIQQKISYLDTGSVLNISFGPYNQSKVITVEQNVKMDYFACIGDYLSCQLDPNARYQGTGYFHGPVRVGSCGITTITVSDDPGNPGGATNVPPTNTPTPLPTLPPGHRQPVPLPSLAPICDQLSGDRNDQNTNRGKCYNCMETESKKERKPHVWTAFGCMPADFSAIIGDFIFKIGIGIAGGISFLYFLYGCFLILTSSGNPEKIEEAKQIIVSALSGLLLIIFSVFILQIIGVGILRLPGFEATNQSASTAPPIPPTTAPPGIQPTSTPPPCTTGTCTNSCQEINTGQRCNWSTSMGTQYGYCCIPKPTITPTPTPIAQTCRYKAASGREVNPVCPEVDTQPCYNKPGKDCTVNRQCGADGKCNFFCYDGNIMVPCSADQTVDTSYENKCIDDPANPPQACPTNYPATCPVAMGKIPCTLYRECGLAQNGHYCQYYCYDNAGKHVPCWSGQF